MTPQPPPMAASVPMMSRYHFAACHAPRQPPPSIAPTIGITAKAASRISRPGNQE